MVYIHQLLLSRVEVALAQKGNIMRRSADGWKKFLTELGLPSLSTIETHDGYVVITVWIDTLTKIDSDEFSDNLAKDIFLGTEVSRVLLNPQEGDSTDLVDATFISEYDKCAIRFFSPTSDDMLMLNERFPYLNELGEINWGGEPQVYLFSLIKEIVGSKLATDFLLSDTSGVSLRRICGLEECEECRELIPQLVENSYHEPRHNSSSKWVLIPRRTGREG